MIERLLRMQTIDGPYLGPTRPVETVTTPRVPFHLPEAKVANPAQAPKLQSLGQHLQIQQGGGVQRIAQQGLQPVTLQSLQQQGLSSAVGVSPEELFLLGLLRIKGSKQQTEQWVPNTSAQLSFIETPQTFLRTLPKARKLRLRGISFMRFRFEWEDETAKSPTHQPDLPE